MPHVTFIHGMANKPDSDALHRIWLEALKFNNGLDLGAEGVTSSMVYWADVLYPEPMPDDGSYESASDDAELEAVQREAPVPEESDRWRDELPADERAAIEAMAAELRVDEPDPVPMPGTHAAGGAAYEAVPLPWALKKPLMERLLRDVHHYLFNTQFSPRALTLYSVQDEVRARTVKALAKGNAAADGGAHVVLSHSLGTVIAYDCLKRVSDCAGVTGLITIGSPLGLDEIQHCMKPQWSRDNGYPLERVSTRWVNIYDRIDPVVGLDPRFADDYRKAGAATVEDINEDNWGLWRHSATKYLKGPKLRKTLAELLGL